MQWNCPHCGVTLAVPFDALGTGWSFSRCYKCGGFALIRRAEVNIIKVDKAPPGEKVLLPEAGTDPTAGLLNEDAAQNLSKHALKMKSDKPTIRPARPVTPPPLPKGIQKYTENDQLSIPNNPQIQADADLLLASRLPDRKKRQLPFGIVLTALFAIGSAIYLYVEGQSIYQRARNSSADSSRSTPEQRISLNETDKMQPAKIEAPTQPHEPLANSNALKEKEETLEIAKNDLSNLGAQTMEKSLITDQIKESAMAPAKVAPPYSNLIPRQNLLVQIKMKRASLHRGPGTQFPVTGIANPDLRYVLADWKDRWFKIAQNSGGRLSEVGWIQNDLVQILPSTSSGRAVP